MPDTWILALKSFSYPVKLTTYGRGSEFPDFFETQISGDRESTIEFENRFRERAPNYIAAFFEVVFWKLYSQPNWREKATDAIVDFVMENNISAEQLCDAVYKFVRDQSILNLKLIRVLLGLRTNVLAVPLTLPALINPNTIPIVDKKTAKWVNGNAEEHNANREMKLTSFNLKYTSLRDDDFGNYLNWVYWCQEVADVLTGLTEDEWRARDVEMAIFTAQRNGMILSVLP